MNGSCARLLIEPRIVESRNKPRDDQGAVSFATVHGLAENGDCFLDISQAVEGPSADAELSRTSRICLQFEGASAMRNGSIRYRLQGPVVASGRPCLFD